MASSPNEPQNTDNSAAAPPAISNMRILWCSIGLTILAAFMLPVQFNNKYKADISITATGYRDVKIKGVEVWVSEKFGSGIVDSAKAAGWERRDNQQVSYRNQPATLRWEGAIDPNYRLYFVRHPQSGQMILTINGTSKEYSLNAETVQPPLEIRPFEFINNPQPTYVREILNCLMTLIGLLALIHLSLLMMIRRTTTTGEPVSFSTLQLGTLALPSIFVYFITLLAMWPAQMSPDSVTHWVEGQDGNINDVHSAMLTSFVWIVSRIWNNPAVIPVIQILGLTCVTVLLVSKLHDLGVPKYLCNLGAIAFPVFPANFLMVTTIWKDVPYTIALLFALWLLLSLHQTHGASAKFSLWRVGFIVSMLLLLFTRHNGIIVALGLPILCAFTYRETTGRHFVITTGIVLAVFLIVKTLMFPLLHVAFIPDHYRPVVAIHILGAHIVNGADFTDDEKKLLQSVHTFDRWKSLYQCQTYGPLFFGDSQGTPSYEALANNSMRLIKLALKKSWEYPGTFVRHQSCVTSMLWRITPFSGEFLHATPLGVSDIAQARGIGLVAAPKFPKVQLLLTKYSFWTQQDNKAWFFWRPGLFLLLSIISGVGLALATKNNRTLLLVAPSLLNTFSLFPVIGSPDYRYQWAVITIGMFLVPLALFRRSISIGSSELTGTTNFLRLPEQLKTKSHSIENMVAVGSILNVISTKSYDKERPVVAVVIPCYKVREHIIQVIKRIGPECSLIYCIDDKCPDQSGAFIKEHSNDPRLRVIFHEDNQGVGGAVMSGYRAAIKEGATVMVKLDGNGQMDPSLLPAFITPIISGDADYTKGNRFYHVEGVREMPLLRLFGNAVLSFLTKLSSGYWSTFDPSNGYTAIHTSVARALPFRKIDRRYFFELDMLFRLNDLRARIVDIPMSASYRGEKSSLVTTTIAGEFLWKHFRNFAKRIGYNYFLRDFSIASLELFLGLPLAIFGFIFGVYSWIVSLDTGVVTTAGTVMLSVLPGILGVQFLLSFLNHDIFRTPSETVHQMLQRLPSSHYEQWDS